MKRAFPCLLQNLGEHMPPVPPSVPTSLEAFSLFGIAEFNYMINDFHESQLAIYE